jgi:hypothetical protein
MKEDFLHFLWKCSLFKKEKLFTTTGENVEIISPGQQNRDAGPDFFNAKIKIDNTLWVGNVEIHLRSSDWKRHVHDGNRAYDNVILHVVAEHDGPVRRNNGEVIPCLILKYDPALEERYLSLWRSTLQIPCGEIIKKTDPFKIKHFLSRLLIERLEERSIHIQQIVLFTNNEWNTVFHQLLFKTFGFNINTAAFELLAKITPHQIISKHGHSLMQLEALLFGQAGMLEEYPKDEYQSLLRSEYRFLQNKFNVLPMDKHVWKFLRLRPSNFPTIRIAQLAKLLHTVPFLTDLANKWNSYDTSSVFKLFDIEASDYWNTHFTFGKLSTYRIKKLGESSINNIIINMLTPYLFTYAKMHGYDEQQEKAVTLLERTLPENNYIIRQWEEQGIKADNAFYTQGLLQLKTAYCDKKRCLHCAIGASIICDYRKTL